MEKAVKLKPQDVVILVKLLTSQNQQLLKQVDLAISLGISQGEIAKAFARLNKAGLVNGKRANRSSALEFLIHAVKYVFPIEIGSLQVGVPTAISAPAHKNYTVHSGEDIYVWPSVKGKVRGQMIKPFYPNLADAALKDLDFYDLMSAVEILRMGRSRERKSAEQYIEKKLKES